MRFPCHVFIVVSLLAHTAAGQQNPQGRLPVTSFPEPYLFLIRDPAVLAELSLTRPQAASVRKVNDDLDAGLMSMRNRSAQHVQRVTSESISVAKTRLATILTPAQRRRVDEIRVRAMGMKAFLNAEVADQLGLSTTQVNQLRDVIEQTADGIDRLRKSLNEGANRQKVEADARQLRVDEQRQILAAISREQQKKWIAMLGKSFDLAQLGKVSFKAPELDSSAGWVNSSPLSLRQLKGKVVALHFYAFA